MPAKSSKDVNAPKKALSAYILFSVDERPKLKASGLENFAEMSRALGAAWKQADSKTRAHYEKEHEKDKVRYENELKEYQESGKPAPSSASVTKAKTVRTPTVKKTTHVKETVPAATSKKAAPISTKSKKFESEDDEKEDDEDDDDDDDGSDEDEESEEEEGPAPPVKSSRKKM